MAEGILGLGSGGAAQLNQELIDKLKEADRKVTVEPIEEQISDWDLELETFNLLEAQALGFLGTLSQFDLYAEDSNAFDQYSASTTGSAGIFDSVNLEDLEEGTNYVEVTQLAQRDVYQMNSWVGDGDTVMDYGALEINGETYSTSGMTYSKFVDSLNASDDISATIVQVSDTESRIVIKSKDPGLDNALTIKQAVGFADFGFSGSQSSSNTVADVDVDKVVGAGQSGTITVNGNEISIDDTMTYQDLANAINALGGISASIADGGTLDITTDDNSALSIDESGIDLGFYSNKTMSAQNLLATVDGVDYDISSNTIDIQGSLTMTAIEVGTATISIQKDNSTVMPALEEFVEQYNTFIDSIEGELSNAESYLEDRSTLRTIVSQVKEMLFDDYGTNGELNIFNFGFELDKSGHLSIDSDTLGEALVDNFDEIKELFVGVAEAEGIGTKLNAYIDDLDGYNGLFKQYSDSMDERKEELELNLEKAQSTLDTKYEHLSSQFAAYGSLISQMESSFSGLKMMIEMEIGSD
jgi:flagellar hook-associated protein 2